MNRNLMDLSFTLVVKEIMRETYRLKTKVEKKLFLLMKYLQSGRVESQNKINNY